ncbi:alpha-amylase [Microbulbifer donghaiensis]|uniref:Alpha-amylase n=1 Tax=Microbulbifer donghaiensis TaxID=494016 RepID=A0A1M4WH09_9GAMM|nr:carbohydrate-binding module family 20 domain-containing protein [Microbulbifer donghaiensis]SHE80516.1 alpha-amylase [Microbulbifer donghaiensis]
MRHLLAMMSTLLLLSAFSAASNAVPRTAFVHLFEWQWDDIASECENFLGPKGFAAVQVSPPQKSVSGSQWWTRYQPVSYAIEGRSGSRAQFASMVSRCKAAGVDIYVDAVINHMAAWDRSFPEVPYGPNDFHNCTDDINYGDAWSIQNCDLVGLNDLKTESDYVRGKIADYMNDLIGLGVAGFRIDAAKHMPAADINAIKSRLNGNPYIFQEVIGAGGEPIQAADYTWVGDVTEFNFTNTIGHYFKLRGPLKEISNIGSWSGWLSSDNAITFVANHDNQRQNTDNTITHKDGSNANNMAHVFTLGWPYGYPKIMSSYDWSDHDQGPPAQGASSCGNGWLCEHRSRPIANMVGFRNNTAAYWGVTDYWDNGNHQMAWGRGGLGFVVLNMEGSNLNRSFQTGMPAGTYCDIIHGDFDYSAGTCSGPTITVDGSGNAAFNVYYRNAAAIHAGAKVGVPCPECGGNAGGETGGGSGGSSGGGSSAVDVSFTCHNGYTYWGQSVYVVGNTGELGSWDPAQARKLDPAAYPTWSGSVDMPANTDVEWKCLKREEANPAAGVEWQSGSNNQFNTSTNSSPTAAF